MSVFVDASDKEVHIPVYEIIFEYFSEDINRSILEDDRSC